MSWILQQDLVLFDFDGLLVDTEKLHYHAYKAMLKELGLDLKWTFSDYCLAAHYTPDRFHKTLKEALPQIATYNWTDLYRAKQKIVHELLTNNPPSLMPGAKKLLDALQKDSISHCVVTNSPDTLVALVRSKHPTLDKIPYWITRHDYTHSKPDPECYQLAIDRYAGSKSNVVGFEDTPRGLNALRGTKAVAILVTRISYPEIADLIADGIEYYPSLLQIET